MLNFSIIIKRVWRDGGMNSSVETVSCYHFIEIILTQNTYNSHIA